MASNAVPKQAFYTYDDYRKFPEELRCEIIDGQVYDMTPAPSVKTSAGCRPNIPSHTEIIWLPTLTRAASSLLPPTSSLPNDQVVQPDVFIICDRSKIRDAAIFGAPDVIFEVLSPSTEIKDRGRKMEIYEMFGVTEYYLIHPDLEYVEKYFLSAAHTADREFTGGSRPSPLTRSAWNSRRRTFSPPDRVPLPR